MPTDFFDFNYRQVTTMPSLTTNYCDILASKYVILIGRHNIACPANLLASQVFVLNNTLGSLNKDALYVAFFIQHIIPLNHNNQHTPHLYRFSIF